MKNEYAALPDARPVKVGDKVAACWYDDPTYYTGEVHEDEQGLFIDVYRPEEGYNIGYLKVAHHVVKDNR